MDKSEEKPKGGIEHIPPIHFDEWGLLWTRGRVLLNIYRDKLVADLAEEHTLGLRESNWMKPHGL